MELTYEDLKRFRSEEDAEAYLSLELTYEDLKLLRVGDLRLVAGCEFGAYLRGFETLRCGRSLPCGPGCGSLELTYEDLKLSLDPPVHILEFPCLELTYEDLKQFASEIATTHLQRLELTYEDLKPRRAASPTSAGSRFGAYLRGFETGFPRFVQEAQETSLELTYEDLKRDLCAIHDTAFF